MTPTTIQLIGAALFAFAILHTFATKIFERLAHTRLTSGGLTIIAVLAFRFL